jgi:alpha-L-fucosidase
MSEATDASFRDRPVPHWYDDCKLGIFVHWGLYSVPAWAPRTGSLVTEVDGAPAQVRFADLPYAEWYANTMRIPGSATEAYHAKTFGADFPYSAFAEDFNREIAAWDPAAWAELFDDAGAGYAVLTTKHHDGFLLWPSRHRNPKAPDFVASRDLYGELARAVRARGLRMGAYYSGGLDWLFHDQVIASIGDMLRAIPWREDYREYATAHWHELIDTYGPCSMWNDIAFPASDEQIEALFEHYYAHVPDGVVNDRFKKVLSEGKLKSAAPHDVSTPEYRVAPAIDPKKWEAVRGIGNSFGYSRDEGEAEYLSARDLIHLFVDIVSKNGNLLLNVGPRADGSIPELQAERLRALGAWLRVNGAALRGTRPWERAEGRTAQGGAVRFTRGRGAVHAILLDPVPGREIEIGDLGSLEARRVRLHGTAAPLAFALEGGRLRLRLPDRLPSEHAVALELATARVE